MKSCRQISIEWQLAERTVTKLCKDGRIPGAIKKGKSWQIPDDAERPKDQRVTTGKYIRSSRNWYFMKEQEIPYGSDKRKPLPIGISEYIRAVSNYYYVDKTLLIKELLDRKHLVTLFTRPRRFGKTLNMDMLRVFFEKTTEDTSQYFRDKAIWQCGTEYTMHQGKYPVIYLTFKDVKFGSWSDTLEKIRNLLQEEFSRHMELFESEALADYEKAYYRRVLDGSASLVDLTSALKNLSKYLAAHHQIAPIIIIDEYDTPIQEGYACNFYDEIISFMRTFFSGGFKDNQHLSYGCMTGILRITQESIFSGMNNLFVNTVMDKEYDDCFGFTESEVSRLLSYYGFEDKMDELREWYDGYLFGQCDIFNPWSVINYVTKGCEPQAYWVSTSRNEILKEVLNIATEDENEILHELLTEKTVYGIIDEYMTCWSRDLNPACIFTLLMNTGYLKAKNAELMGDGSYLCEITIPNKEIGLMYKRELLAYDATHKEVITYDGE